MGGLGREGGKLGMKVGMKLGGGLFGVALISLLLAGPVGPCGPGTFAATIFMLIGFLAGLGGYVVFGASVIVGLAARGTRSDLRVPAFLAIPLAGVLAVFLTRADEPRLHTLWFLAGTWPPSVTAAFVVQLWVRKRTAGRADTPKI